jgi:hypothetical protein
MLAPTWRSRTMPSQFQVRLAVCAIHAQRPLRLRLPSRKQRGGQSARHLRLARSPSVRLCRDEFRWAPKPASLPRAHRRCVAVPPRKVCPCVGVEILLGMGRMVAQRDHARRRRPGFGRCTCRTDLPGVLLCSRRTGRRLHVSAHCRKRLWYMPVNPTIAGSVSPTVAVSCFSAQRDGGRGCAGSIARGARLCVAQPVCQ